MEQVIHRLQQTLAVQAFLGQFLRTGNWLNLILRIVSSSPRRPRRQSQSRPHNSSPGCEGNLLPSYRFLPGCFPLGARRRLSRGAGWGKKQKSAINRHITGEAAALTKQFPDLQKVAISAICLGDTETPQVTHFG